MFFFALIFAFLSGLACAAVSAASLTGDLVAKYINATHVELKAGFLVLGITTIAWSLTWLVINELRRR